MWSLYLAEAEKVDKALVESWTGDMDGILIFAGLFSASVTAFIIESYKKLSPDSGDTTVALLVQISSQLEALSSGTNVTATPPSQTNIQFRPTTSMVTVNILWFLSLALGLACALSATLVQQWARNYLQLIERRPMPNQHARMRAYMYEGVKMFKMTAVIEAIPTLLHISLLLFFIGLVIFLVPIDRHVALSMVVVLTMGVILYATVTILPIRHKSCPYQTPLSPTCRNVIQYFYQPCYNRNYYFKHGQRHNPSYPTRGSLADAREFLATQKSPERDSRDLVALNWTLESATDYSELERFFDAVPAFYRTPRGHHNSGFVLGMLASSVFDRSWPMLQDCIRQADVHSLTRRRRAVACMAAIQAVAPQLRSIPRIFLQLWGNAKPTLLLTDSDTTIAALAMCMSASLACSFLSHIAWKLPSESDDCNNAAADEKLLMEISEQIPVNELAPSATADGSPMSIDTSPPSTDVKTTASALRVLKSEAVMDAAERYLRFCRRSATSMRVRTFFQMNDGFYDSAAERLTQSLAWTSLKLIEKAEISVQHLKNPQQDSNSSATNRAVWAISWMLRGLRTKKMRKELWNSGRLMTVNVFIARLMSCQCDTREYSALILETLHHLIGSRVSSKHDDEDTVNSVDQKTRISVNDADQETQAEFIRIVTDAVSPVRDVQPFTFPVVKPLVRLLSDLDHPTSIALAIDAIDGNQWLLDNKFPLEETVQDLKEKLERSRRAIKSTPEYPANNPSSFSGPSRVTASVAGAANECDGAKGKNDGAAGETNRAVGEENVAADGRGGSVGAIDGEDDRTVDESDGAANDSGGTSSAASRH